MNVKKGKKSEIWAMLFAYLTISKAFYWANIIGGTLNQGSLRDLGEVVLLRFLNQDMLIILGIVLVTFMEKFVQSKMSKYKKVWRQIIEHVIIYLLMSGAAIAYLWVMALISGTPLNINLGESLFFGGIMYLAIGAIFEAKRLLKKKEMTTYASALSMDEKLSMLKTLHDSGVFTQEEYERKKGEINL